MLWLEIRQDSGAKPACSGQKPVPIRHFANFQTAHKIAAGKDFFAYSGFADTSAPGIYLDVCGRLRPYQGRKNYRRAIAVRRRAAKTGKRDCGRKVISLDAFKTRLKDS